MEPEPQVDNSTVDEMKSACLEAIAASEPLRKAIYGRVLPWLFIGVVPFLLFLLIAGAVFVLIW